MKKLLASLLLAGASAAGAQTSDPAPQGATSNEVSSSAMSSGEVRRIDRGQRKITLRHGEIKSLDMPPMTMVFQVKDAAWLDALKVGDKVSFRAEKIGGVFTVTAIESAP